MGVKKHELRYLSRIIVVIAAAKTGRDSRSNREVMTIDQIYRDSEM